MERSVRRAERAWNAGTRAGGDADMWLDSAAMSLHAFYSGLERLLEHVALQLDEGIPKGPDWHRELLRQMELDAGARRPAVLAPQTVADLAEYLGFRHVVRNIYAHQFSAERVGRLVSDLDPAWCHVRNDLTRFADFLEGVSRADDIVP